MTRLKRQPTALAASERASRARVYIKRAQSGVTTIEYALLAGLIGLALVVCLGELKEALAGVFQAIAAALNAVPR